MIAHEKFAQLARAVRQAHEDVGLTAAGHDFDHDLRVAEYAAMVAPDERTAYWGAAAGFCHSADRVLGSIKPGCTGELENLQGVEDLVRRWLLHTDLTTEEKDEVVFAVVHHEGANREEDSPLQMTLKDADRLANLDADVIIRSGQFQPHLLAVDPIHLENDPGATYRDPRSVLWDVNNCISWMASKGPYVLRLTESRRLGAERAWFLQLFVETIRAQRAEIGLIPYPIL